jgi:hypothetical protein
MQQILGLLEASTPSDAAIARVVGLGQSGPNFCFVSAFCLANISLFSATLLRGQQ